MVRVVGVRFKKAGKVYYFDPDEYGIEPGAKVVVETARGIEYGEVAVGPKDVDEDQVVQPLKKVLRVATERDAIIAAENKRKEREAFSVAQKKIESHTLEMNLVDVEYTFDGSKVIFYFTAEGRVDFRELVRDLAGAFRTRIEMRQIGVRDEAKLLGGIGPCGRILCCTSFLGDFAPVSIRMAKDQNLSLNPSKISGLCGRLMCCLRYEQETYEAAKKDPTLAPGYVPPVLLQEPVPSLADLEDRPAPAIGIRAPRDGSGMSARIAQAAGLAERPVRREERPDRRQQGERAPGGERTQQPRQHQPGAGPRPQGGRPPGGGPREQDRKGQAQQPRPQGGERQQPQGKPVHRGGAQPSAGGKPQGQQHGRPPGQRPPGQQPRPQQGQGQPQSRPQPDGRVQGGDQPPRPQGQGDQQRSRPPRHRRRGRGGERPQPETEVKGNGGE